MREYVVTGSLAAQYHGIDLGRQPTDIDIIATPKGLNQFSAEFGVSVDKSIHKGTSPGGINTFPWQFMSKSGDRYVVEIEHANFTSNVESSSRYLLTRHQEMQPDHPFMDPYWLLIMKLSHRYLKNSPHFEKTRGDIFNLAKYVNSETPSLTIEDTIRYADSNWLCQMRQKETYNYQHPKLNQSKQDFFSDDGIEYVYDHDDLHKVVAVYKANPLYTQYKIEGEEVACSKEKWDNLSDANKNLAVYEEAAVLALERAIIPHGAEPEAAYKMALQKICTSITSGWFREWAWWNYDEILSLGDLLTFKSRFDTAIKAGTLVPLSEKAVSSA